jgi:hypothetical protein
VRGHIVGVELHALNDGGSRVKQPGGFVVQLVAPPRGQHDLTGPAADQPLRDRESDFTATTEDKHRSRHLRKSARR